MKKLIERFHKWQARARQERENLFDDWLLNDELQQRWRLKVLTWLAYVFCFFGVVDGFRTLQAYLHYPEYQKWGLLTMVIVAVPWISMNLIVLWLVRGGKSQPALYVMLFNFLIGPPFLGTMGLEGFSRYYNISLLFLSILLVSFIAQPRSRQTLILACIFVWFAVILTKYFLSSNSLTAQVPLFLETIKPGVVASSLMFYLVLILQFQRLSVSNKIMLSFLTAMHIMYEVTLGYSEQAMEPYMQPAEITRYLSQLQFTLELTIGGITLAVLVMTQVISRPLTRLMDVALKVREGDLKARTKISSIDETGQLSKVFNQMTDRLSETLDGLERSVVERTRDLEIAFRVSKQITQVLRLDELLPKLAENTREGFDLYFVSVYLYDPEKQSLVLSAGTGEAGQQMKVEGKVYEIEARPSIVAQAGREREAVVITDVSGSPLYFPNPHLPHTSSEAAIPMVVQGELVGVLGVQSMQANDFGEQNLRILTSLAEQIGVAVKNARLYEEQLLVSEELKKLDLMKSQFLSSMSHELRTPLNAIMNFVEMTASGMIGPVNQEQEELLNQALESSKHLLHLINDVLDISKIQAGKLTLFVEEQVDLQQEIDAVLNMVAGLIRDKSLSFIKDIDRDLPKISCDRRRVRQVLLNLLTNAIKFTENGSITLRVKDHWRNVQFAVIDTGPGISQAEQEMIFEPFMQTESGAKQVQGTGLGLPISRSLVQVHGGELWVESQAGKGSSFFFTLPANRTSML